MHFCYGQLPVFIPAFTQYHFYWLNYKTEIVILCVESNFRTSTSMTNTRIARLYRLYPKPCLDIIDGKVQLGEFYQLVQQDAYWQRALYRFFEIYSYTKLGSRSKCSVFWTSYWIGHPVKYKLSEKSSNSYSSNCRIK
jgi:hypothetical protein